MCGIDNKHLLKHRYNATMTSGKSTLIESVSIRAAPAIPLSAVLYVPSQKICVFLSLHVNGGRHFYELIPYQFKIFLGRKYVVPVDAIVIAAQQQSLFFCESGQTFKVESWFENVVCYSVAIECGQLL